MPDLLQDWITRLSAAPATGAPPGDRLHLDRGYAIDALCDDLRGWTHGACAHTDVLIQQTTIDRLRDRAAGIGKLASTARMYAELYGEQYKSVRVWDQIASEMRNVALRAVTARRCGVGNVHRYNEADAVISMVAAVEGDDETVRMYITKNRA